MPIPPTHPMNALISVPFHNQTIVAIEHNGKPYIAMRPIVENLGLAWQVQHRKITEKFSKGVTIMVIPSAGGLQEMLCLPISKLAGFLYSINPSKVKPELRETIIAYQDECDTVLFNHFFNSANVERHALLDAIFQRHPQWSETVDYLRQGKTNREIASLQGKHIRNVQRMQQRIRAAGIDCRPVARLTQQAA